MTDEGFGVEADVEAYMQELGTQRFRKALQGARDHQQEARTGGAKRLVQLCLQDTAQSIRSYTRPRRGHQPAHLRQLRKIHPERAAMIALKTVLDQMSMQLLHQSVALQIGARIEDEIRLDEWRRADPKSFLAAMRRVKYSGDYRYKHRVLVYISTRTEAFGWSSWSKKERLSVGMVLLNIIIESTGIVESRLIPRSRTRKRRVERRIYPSEKAVEWVRKYNLVAEGQDPWYLPMIEEPKPWTSPWHGGYEQLGCRLVKTNRTNYLEQLEHVSMPKVYQLVNKLQSTPWRINQDVLVVAEELWDRGIGVGSLPVPGDDPLPPKPEDIDTDEAARKAWKTKASQVHSSNCRRRSHVLLAGKLLSLARLFAAQPRIYVPHQLDWRGRAYPIPSLLSPQGNDLSRGLLEFAEGKPVDSGPALDALMIHGANCWGEDKVSYAARIAWVDQHHEQIEAVAADPLTNGWWMEADKPWSFLAWCFDFASHEPSHLPVHMDGSCNGLQHLAAMQRDDQGARAVNLTPAEKPQDVYGIVAERVAEKAEYDDKYSPSPDLSGIARQWLKSGILDRKTVKRQVMTVPYGATYAGHLEQLRSWLEEIRTKHGGRIPFEDQTGREAVHYLAPKVSEAIRETIVAATEVMGWFQACARILTEAGVPIRWTTPVGFPVLQVYYKTRDIRVKTHLMGSVMKLRLKEDTDSLDKRRQCYGISPNVIHSYDASHLAMTLARFVELAGPEVSLSAIHDSYATHAADAFELSLAVREAFVELYEPNRLAALREEWQRQLPDGRELPQPPKLGSLDISDVLRSPYFFG